MSSYAACVRQAYGPSSASAHSRLKKEPELVATAQVDRKCHEQSDGHLDARVLHRLVDAVNDERVTFREDQSAVQVEVVRHDHRAESADGLREPVAGR